MAALGFRDIIELINHSRTSFIEDKPKLQQDGKWQLYSGYHNVHASRFPFSVLYLGSSSTQDDLRRALRQTANEERRHIVYASSTKISPDLPDLRSRQNVVGVWSLRQYLVSFFQEEISAYLSRVVSDDPRYYINPPIETPSGFRTKIPNPILSFLTDSAAPDAAGKLGIVLAEPGQGKTYMTKYLVSRVSERDRDLVPLMVDSSQWQTMSLEDQRSLPKTIAHSFRHFGATIGWLEGHEDQFLRATLKADVFRIIFDGFDEYILRNFGAVQPMEVLEALADLARVTDTRIVITSRTSFWFANLSDKEIERFLDQSGAFIFKICPFNQDHARRYFGLRLDEAKSEVALSAYRSIAQADDELAGRGFVLSLIADLAADGNPAPGSAALEQDPMEWLTEALCEREALRQQLPYTGKEQLDAFTLFAVEAAQGSLPTSALLEGTLAAARPALDAALVHGSLDKLKSHPLLEWIASDDTWRFKQEQVTVSLLAEEIARETDSEVARFAERARLDPAVWQDLANALVQLVFRRSSSVEDAERRIAHLVRLMSVPTIDPAGVIVPVGDGHRFAAMIALLSVDRCLPKGSSRQERAQLLARFCGGDAIENLQFSGTVASYDFSGRRFYRCGFLRVTWANCIFNESTSFIECSFSGGVTSAHSDNFGAISFLSCQYDPEAEAVINSERIRAGKKVYTEEDLRNDLHAVLKRFVGRGGLGIKTIESSTMMRGAIGASPHGRDVVNALKGSVIDTHRISGDLEGFHIRPDAVEAVRFFAANNVFTGPIRETYEKLCAKLRLD